MTKNEFKKIREGAGITQERTGEILGKTKRMIQNYESGHDIPKLVAEKMVSMEKPND